MIQIAASTTGNTFWASPRSSERAIKTLGKIVPRGRVRVNHGLNALIMQNVKPQTCAKLNQGGQA